MRIFLAVLLLLLSGCYKDHLYVQQENVDVTFLASYWVRTPDPRLANPPRGQRLLIGWDFPYSLFSQDLILKTTVRFWDNEEKVIEEHVNYRRGSTAYAFSEADRNKILTYKVEVVTEDGEIVETWKHHFWTERIVISDERSE